MACGQIQPAGGNTNSQTKTEAGKSAYPSLKIQANEVGNATINGDFAKVVDYTYPKVLEMVGGRDKMLTLIKQGDEQNKADGVSYVSVEIGDPGQIEKIDTQIFAVLPMKLTMKAPDGKFIGESALVGISDDGGQNWKFISSVSQKRFNAVFPKAADKIKMPEEKQPTMVEQ